MLPASSIVKIRSGAGIACTIASANNLISVLDTIALCLFRDLTQYDLDYTCFVVDVLFELNPLRLSLTSIPTTNSSCHSTALRRTFQDSFSGSELLCITDPFDLVNNLIHASNVYD